MKMTLMQHFAEFRRRLLWLVVIFVVSFCFGWYLSPYIENILVQPLLRVWNNAQMLYTGVSDGLMIHFSLATLFAVIISLPACLWHVWAYVAPGLHKKEKQFAFPIFVCSPLLFCIGACFAFYILLPFVFKFFIDMNDSASIPTILLPVVRGYLSFAIDLIKIFGVAFQLPLILILLNKAGILTKQTIQKFRRYVIICIFVLAAMLTPPDVVSQILLAVPMCLLFEISLLFMNNNR